MEHCYGSVVCHLSFQLSTLRIVSRDRHASGKIRCIFLCAVCVGRHTRYEKVQVYFLRIMEKVVVALHKNFQHISLSSFHIFDFKSYIYILFQLNVK